VRSNTSFERTRPASSAKPKPRRARRSTQPLGVMDVIRTFLVVASLCGFGAAIWNGRPVDPAPISAWALVFFLNSAWLVALLLSVVVKGSGHPLVAVGGLATLAAGEFLVHVTYSDPILRLFKPFGQTLLMLIGAGLVASFRGRRNDA
jgi:hypothetical protein